MDPGSQHKHDDHHHHHHHHHGSYFSFIKLFKYVGANWNSTEAKWMIIYGGMIAITSIVQVVLGIMLSDIHEVTKGFNSLFHTLSIFAALLGYSFAQTHNVPDSKFTFGYGRSEVIAAFANGILLIFVTIYKILELGHEIGQSVYGEESAHEALVPLTNILLIKCFLGGAMMLKFASYILSPGLPSPHSDNISIMILHVAGLVLGDTMHSIFDHLIPDSAAQVTRVVKPAAILLMLSIIIYLSKTFLQRTGEILLLTAPSYEQRQQLAKLFREIALIEGVDGIAQEKIWRLTQTQLVCCIQIRVYEGSNAREIVAKVQTILQPYVKHLVVEVCGQKKELEANGV